MPDIIPVLVEIWYIVVGSCNPYLILVTNNTTGGSASMVNRTWYIHGGGRANHSRKSHQIVCGNQICDLCSRRDLPSTLTPPLRQHSLPHQRTNSNDLYSSLVTLFKNYLHEYSIFLQMQRMVLKFFFIIIDCFLTV